MDRARYRLSALIQEKEGELEEYRESVVGCRILDYKTNKLYALYGENAEYYISQVLREKCSLADILDNKQIKSALQHDYIFLYTRDKDSAVIDTPLENVEYDYLDAIASKTDNLRMREHRIVDMVFTVLIAIMGIGCLSILMMR